MLHWRVIVAGIIALLNGVTVLNAQFSENFSDGNLSLNPTWLGELANFSTSGTQQLQLNAPAVTDVSSISTAANLDFDAQIIWEFWLQLNFDPSSNNNARFYLASDNSNLEASLNGYYVRLGENGALDALTLYRQSGITSTVLLTGSANIYASMPICRVRVVREANGIWNLSSDPTGGTDFVPEGSVQDDTFTSMSFVGWYCKYTTTNSTNFLLDDVQLSGTTIIDETAPLVVNTEVIDAQSLDIYFNEALDSGSAENENNYLLEGSENPLTASLDLNNSSLVHLTFANNFPENIEQSIVISSVEDLNGNAIVSVELNFTYVVASVAGYREVVINEIFPDPTPTFGLPVIEFLELHNPSENFFQLENWKLVNSTTIMTLPSFVLEPGGHVIICQSATVGDWQVYGDVIGLTSFVALTNTADSLTLINELDEIIDIVVYTDDWYQDVNKEDGGWTLEQINPEFQCSGSFNWRASENPSGGTPGMENSVLDLSPDTEAPFIVSSSYLEGGIIEIIFNEPIDNAIIETLEFTLIFGPGVINITAGTNAESILITLDSELLLGAEYTFILNGIRDCSGNESGELSSMIVTGYAPEAGDLIINEIMADPTPALGLPEAEYLEIHNVSGNLIDLSKCMLNGLVLPQRFIAPGGYEVVVDDVTFQDEIYFSEAISLAGWSSTYLTNSGRDLVLRDLNLTIIDSLHYDITWYNDPAKDDGGWSIERINSSDPCSSADNWRASVSQTGGTPGVINSVNDDSPDTKSPALLSIYVLDNDLIELVFAEPIDPSTAETAEYLFSNGLNVDNIEVGLSPTSSVQIEVLPELEEGIIYTIQINGLSDCWGNGSVEESGRFALAENYEAGDIIINEILSDPKTESDDFIELYNRSMKNISINGWHLANEESGFPADFEMITDRPYMLFPGEYVALTTAGAGLDIFYPGTVVENVLETEGFPTYNNDEGVVYLLNPFAEVMDRVEYSSDWHFGLLDATDGVSLERIDSERSSQDATNWLSASEAVGFATPGYKNSQAFSGELQAGTFYAEPEVFSPDNDGYQDVVTFFYELEIPGQVGDINIYDDSGREIRQLVRNDLLGTKGAYSWDGLSDRNEKAAIGIYIVVLELFDLEGNTSMKKIPCVVAHPF